MITNNPVNESIVPNSGGIEPLIYLFSAKYLYIKKKSAQKKKRK